MGKCYEVFKGLLLAFESRIEFSSSQVPGFIPVHLFDFSSTWSSYRSLYTIHPMPSRSQGGTYGQSNITSFFSISGCCCTARQAWGQNTSLSSCSLLRTSPFIECRKGKAGRTESRETSQCAERSRQLSFLQVTWKGPQGTQHQC